MQPQTEIVASGNAQIAVEWAGNGRPIVFLHANVADRRMWRHQFDTLSDSYRVIAFDRRGFGETRMVDEPYSQTDDLFAVLDQLADSKEAAILVGCSRGGGIAIDAALAAPKRIAALVLVAPGVGGAPVTTPISAVQRLLDATAAASKLGDLDKVNRLQAALWLDGPLAKEGRVGGQVRELFLSMNAVALAAPSLNRAIEPEPAWDRLDQITVPVRILCGALDIPHIKSRCEQLAARLPNGRLEMLNGCAHLPSLEIPEHFTERLLTVLAECNEVTYSMARQHDE